MGTFRPPMHQAQQCPICSVPHFPFCTSNHAFESHRHQHYLGQAGPHRPYEALHPRQPFFRPPNAMPEPGFRVGNFLPPDAPLPSDVSFPGAPQYHAAKYQQHFSSNRIADVDAVRQGGTNGWLEPRRETYFQQQQRATESVSDFPIAGRDFREDFYRIREDAKVLRDAKWSDNGSESLTGLSNGKDQFLPGNDRFVEGPHSPRAEYQQGKGSVKQNDHFTQWLYSSAGSYAHDEVPGFVRERAQQPDASRFCRGGTGTFTSVDENQKHDYYGPPQRSEGIRRECGSFAGGGMSREEELIRQHDLHMKPYEQKQEYSDYVSQIRNLKRKHPVTGHQPLSREEELLIEKGLIEDDYVGSDTHQSCRFQADVMDQSMPRGKQVRVEAMQHNQSKFLASNAFSEKEPCSTRVGYQADLHQQGVQSLSVQNERINMDEGKGVATTRHTTGWPSCEPYDRCAKGDAPLDERKLFKSDFVHLRVRDSSSNNPMAKSFIQVSEGRSTNNDHLYRQYHEWEAEAQHMEALKRAEKIAREIQQRDQKRGSPTSQKEELMKGQAFEHHASMLKPESTQPGSDVKPLHHNTAGIDHSMFSEQHGILQMHPSAQQMNRQGHMNDVQSTNLFPRGQQLHSLAEERHAFTNIGHQYAGQESWQQRGVDDLPASSVQSLKPHIGGQYPHENNPYISFQSEGHSNPHQYTQHLAHLYQESECLQSYYSKSGVWEAPLKTFDRNANALHPDHELPPLPVGASINPPPPDSPPPPPPPSNADPSLDDTPARTPAPTSFPYERLSNAQGPTTAYSRQSQMHSFPPEGQSFGQHDLHQSHHLGASQGYPPQFQAQASQQLEKSKVVDAVNIFRNPGRTSRPDRIVVIFRGLPGSGKSYLAKALRDVEIMNGGCAPRIHSMDDYFTCEVEKEEDVETGSSSLRTKKKVMKRVMEYCYEPEMEEAYRVSMLKAFKKTLDEGMFKFVIVDDRNVLIADFAQFWAIAKRSGYEAYILEAPYSDVKGCAARNVHDFTEQQIQAMADRWEPTPSLYLRLDMSSLFRADDLNAQDIIEVDMDAEDLEGDLEEEEESKIAVSQDRFFVAKERPIIGDRWEDKVDNSEEAVPPAKGKSSVRDHVNSSGTKKKAADNALSGLMTMYGKKDKFVHWPDNQGPKGSSIGFSIGSAAQKKGSLIIGPGSGYNGISNCPVAGGDETGEVLSFKKRSKFVEQLRAEQEAFKAVSTRRRQRIGGMDEEDDD